MGGPTKVSFLHENKNENKNMIMKFEVLIFKI